MNDVRLLDVSNSETRAGGSFSAPEVAHRCKRSCTDVPCLLIFILCVIGQIVVAVVAFRNGNMRMFLNGVDFLGNVCGSPPTVPPVASDFESRNFVWYPVTFDPLNQKMIIVEALQWGICVQRCPVTTDVAITAYYPRDRSALGSSLGGKVWPVLFDSVEVFGRCVPKFLSFECANATQCVASIASALDEWEGAAGVLSMTQRGIQEIRAGWWILTASLLAALVLSLVWLFIMRCALRIIVRVVMIALLLSLVAFGAVCLAQLVSWTPYVSLGLPVINVGRSWLWAGMVGSWVLAVLYVALLVFLWSSVTLACDIIAEATRVIADVPTAVLTPLVVLVVSLPVVLWGIAVVVFVQSVGSSTVVTVGVPTFLPSVNFANITDVVHNPLVRNVTNVALPSFEAGKGKAAATAFTVFATLWSVAFWGAVGFMAVAGCATMWYWSTPGDVKRPPPWTLCSSFALTMRYHLGTLAVGSFLIALLQLAQIALGMLEQRIRRMGSTEARVAVRCLQCCAACLERVLRYFTRMTYVVTATDGRSFFPAASEVMKLFATNTILISIVPAVSLYVLMFFKFLVTASVAVMAWVLSTTTLENVLDGNVGDAEKLKKASVGGVMLVVVSMLIAFIVASLFANVYGACIDAIMVSYCYDVVYTEVDYFPRSLEKHLVRAGSVEDAKRKYRMSQEKKQQSPQTHVAAKSVNIVTDDL